MIPTFLYFLRIVCVVVPKNVKFVFKLHMNVKTANNLSVKAVVRKFINIANEVIFHPKGLVQDLLMIVALKYLIFSLITMTTVVLQFTVILKTAAVMTISMMKKYTFKQ